MCDWEPTDVPFGEQRNSDTITDVTDGQRVVSIHMVTHQHGDIENADTDTGSYILLLAFMINLCRRQMTDACLLESVSFRSSQVPDMPPTLSAEVLPNGAGNMPLDSGEPQGAMV